MKPAKGQLLKKRGSEGSSSQPARLDESAVAKLFEEVKMLVRDLPERVQESVGRRRSGQRKLLHPMMFEEVMFHPELRSTPHGEAASWLMLGSLAGDDVPWLHEIAMEMYRACSSQNPELIAATRDAARRTARALSQARPFRHLMRGDDRETHMMMRHFPEMLDHFFALSEPQAAQDDSPSTAKSGSGRKPS